jgi:arsenate reductase-like glutaredoxin family protein
MAKKIDWMYQRKHCTTCQKARDYLETAEKPIQESVDAAKIKYDNDQALALLTGMDKMVAMKGKKVVTFDLKKEKPDDETILAHLIGPTGNLRAPTAKVGKTLLVGFSEEVYKQFVG